MATSPDKSRATLIQEYASASHALFADRPTLHSVARSLAQGLLDSDYPHLKLTADVACLGTPYWSSSRTVAPTQVPDGYHFISLTDALLQRFTLPAAEGASVAALPTNAPRIFVSQRLPVPAPLRIDLEAFTHLLHLRADLLLDFYKEHLLAYWNKSGSGTSSRLNSLAKELSVLMENDNQRQLLDLEVAGWASSLGFTAKFVRYMVLMVGQDEKGRKKHEVLPAIVYRFETLDGKYESIDLRFNPTVEDGWTSATEENLGRLMLKYVNLVSQGPVEWDLSATPDRRFFWTLAATLITHQLSNIDLIERDTGLGDAYFQTRLDEVTDPSRWVTELGLSPQTLTFTLVRQRSNCASTASNLSPASLPGWLTKASVEDGAAYSALLLELANLYCRTGANDYLEGIGDIASYTRSALLKKIQADHPGFTDIEDPAEIVIETDKLNLEGILTLNPEQGAAAERIRMTLPEMALANLGGVRASRFDISLAGKKPGAPTGVPVWMTSDYLKQVILHVDIGQHYPALLKEKLITDVEESRRREALFCAQLRVQLPLLALEAKITGKEGLTSLGYRYIQAVVQADAKNRQVEKQDIVLRALAFIAEPGAKRDVVEAMFVIGPRDIRVGPHLLYRPLFDKRLCEFATWDALLAAIKAPEDLRKSVLTWMSSHGRTLYDHGGFEEPHLNQGIRPDVPQPLPPRPKPAVLSDEVISEDFLHHLFVTTTQALVRQADTQSVSNAEERWAFWVGFGWQLFNQALMVVRGPLAVLGFAVVIEATTFKLFEALNSDDPEVRVGAWRDVFTNLAFMSLHFFSSAFERVSEGVSSIGKLFGEFKEVVATPQKLARNTELPGPAGELDLSWDELNILTDEQAFSRLVPFKHDIPSLSLASLKVIGQGPRTGLIVLHNSAGKLQTYARLGSDLYRVTPEFGAVRLLAVDGSGGKGPWLERAGSHWRVDSSPRLPAGGARWVLQQREDGLYPPLKVVEEVDVSLYGSAVVLPAGLKPNELGLYLHDRKTFLSLEANTFEVTPGVDSATYQVEAAGKQVPTSMALRTNGAGAWWFAFENPLTWAGEKLIQRLAPELANVSKVTAERVLQASGIDESVLRRVHVERLRPPALLEDTALRFELEQDIQVFIERLQKGESPNGGVDAYHMTLQLLVEEPLWPTTRVLRLLGEGGRTLQEYPKSQPASVQRLELKWRQVVAGDLLDLVLTKLTEQEQKSLLGEEFGSGQIQHSVRLHNLRKKLADRAALRRPALYEAHYTYRTASSDPAIAVVQRDFKTLPTSVVRELIRSVTDQERTQLSVARRVPLRVAEEARYYLQEIRLARAYEGVYLDSIVNADSDKLILHALARLPEWPDDLRIEVRANSFGGKLLDSVGAQQASTRKFLIKSGDTYEARDELDQELHGADDLYASVLHALPNAERRALGFDIWQKAALQLKLRQSRLPTRAELRHILGQPPIKPNFRSPFGLAEGRPGYPLSGRGQLGPTSTRALDITRAAVELYPRSNWPAIERFLGLEEAGDLAVRARLQALKAEYLQMSAVLDTWANVSPGMQAFGRREAVQRIKACWRRETAQAVSGDGQPFGHKLLLTAVDANDLPAFEADFLHVGDLDLTGSELSNVAALDVFLRKFPRLRWLSLGFNNLTALPLAIGELSGLTQLRLGGNRILLGEQAIAALERLTNLKILDLGGNPVGQLPNFSAMTQLNQLVLRNTRLQTWPVGYEQLHNLLVMDLRDNQLTTIPQVVSTLPWQRLRYLNLENNPLNAEAFEVLRAVADRTGQRLGVFETAPVQVESGVSRWLQDVPVDQHVARREVWTAIESTPNSRRFIEEIKALVNSQDYLSSGNRPELSRRVWQMLDAIAAKTTLRDRLFSLATELETCPDGVSIMFSDLGFEVLLDEAQAAEDEVALVKLARGLSRLSALAEIADVEYRSQLAAQQQPDEVEIHLAYRAGLESRLELPWQPQSMRFRGLSRVTAPMIEQAYSAVQERELAGGLARSMVNLKRPFWREYLESRYKTEVEANTVLYHAKLEDLETLKDKISEWIAAQEPRKTVLGEAIKVLGEKAGQSQAELFSGAEMTDEQYLSASNAIADEQLTLLRTLTQAALDRVAADEQAGSTDL